MESEMVDKKQSEHEKVQDALSNVLILRNIFKQLSLEDVKRCCSVNKAWRAESIPYLHYFFVELNIFPDDRYLMDIIEKRGWEKTTVISQYAIERVPKVLQNAYQNGRIVVEVHLKVPITYPKVLTFLSQAGRYVSRLRCIAVDLPISKFTEIVSKYLPNVEELALEGPQLKDAEPNEEGAPASAPPTLRKLKRVTGFDSSYNSYSSEYTFLEGTTLILKAAPNLEEIDHFPLEHVDALTLSGKVRLVNGILYPVDVSGFDEGESVEKWLGQLAKLKPNLKFLDPPRSPHLGSSRMFRRCRKHLFSIMESSKNSLEHLIVFPTQRLGYQKYPRGMNSVKILEFANECNFSDQILNDYTHMNKYLNSFAKRKPQRRFFHEETHLKEIFPNVTQIRIELEDLSPLNFVEYFPEETFHELRPTSLYINERGSHCLDQLIRAFPLVSEVVLNITDMQSDTLRTAVGKLREFKNLRRLALEMDNCSFFHEGAREGFSIETWSTNRKSYPVFDSVLTGIPEEVCERLRNSRESLGKEDLEEFKDEPAIFRLKGLESLDIIFNRKYPNYIYCRCTPCHMMWTFFWNFENPLMFSEVSCEFGFGAHRNVRARVLVQDGHPTVDGGRHMNSYPQIIEWIKAAVGPAMRYVELDMYHQPPLYIRTNVHQPHEFSDDEE